jgi:hypothetical protein
MSTLVTLLLLDRPFSVQKHIPGTFGLGLDSVRSVIFILLVHYGNRTYCIEEPTDIRMSNYYVMSVVDL